MPDIKLTISDDTIEELEKAVGKRYLTPEKLVEAILEEKLNSPENAASATPSTSQEDTDVDKALHYIGKVRQEVHTQLEPWASFLNGDLIGILLFTLAIACLGTNAPGINAAISLAFILLIWYQGRKNFPRVMEEIEKRAETDENAKFLLKVLTGDIFRNRETFRRYPVFAFGFFFLFAVIILSFISFLVPQLDLNSTPSWLENLLLWLESYLYTDSSGS